MKYKRLFAVIGLLTFVGIAAYNFYQNDNIDNGKVYVNKAALCRQFAQSYLRTIRKTENIDDYGSEKWKMAIDVETDMYNLCLVDLNKEALKNYKVTAIEKYHK